MRYTFALFAFLFILLPTSEAQERTAKPGDMVTATVLEREGLSGSVVVDSDGSITLPMPIGAVEVLGLTATQINDLLVGRLREYIVDPTVFVSISPAEGFNVHVLGEVVAPNFVKVPEGTTLQEVVTRAGGFTPLADTSQILLIREQNGALSIDPPRITHIVDFSNFTEHGQLEANPVLKVGDVLIVPRLAEADRPKPIRVMGFVANPGSFDAHAPLSILDLLGLAGGPTADAALDRVTLLTVRQGVYSWVKIDFGAFLMGEDRSANLTVPPGSTVFVPRQPEPPQLISVNVMGQVVRPGTYPIKESSRLLDAISQAGGFVDEAAISKVEILSHQIGGQAKRTVDVAGYLAHGTVGLNPMLNPGDTVLVPVSQDAKQIPAIDTALSPSARFTIIGEVNAPGSYSLPPAANLLDLLGIAGGPTSEADLKRVTVMRSDDAETQQPVLDLEQVLVDGKLDLMPLLQTGDSIFIPRLKQPKPFWGTFVQIVRDLSTVVIFYLLVTGQK